MIADDSTMAHGTSCPTNPLAALSLPSPPDPTFPSALPTRRSPLPSVEFDTQHQRQHPRRGRKGCAGSHHRPQILLLEAHRRLRHKA